MTRDADGWWTATEALPPGTDYAFRLDGGPPRADPRARRLPAGVHGPGRTWDPRAHRWTDGGWRGADVTAGVIYELHVGTFTRAGTLDAAIAGIPHLVELGVDTVELMPLAAFDGRRGWGYDGVALWAVHEPYGGPDALCRFVAACHAAGLAVVVDVVHNHVGPSGNHLAEFGPYFTDRHATPWGPAVDLDQEGATGVRDWIVSGALAWLADFHLDGLRLDAVHALVDRSPRHLLAELSDRVAELSTRLGRPLSLIAESNLDDTRVVTPTGEATPTGPGLGSTAQWDDDAHHAVHALITGERAGYYADFGDPATFARVWTHGFLHDGTAERASRFRGGPWGAPVDRARVGGHRFVAFWQNHDQVGNRGRGDRPDAVRDPGGSASAAALLLTSPFVPMLFMGEEWGAATPWQYFTDHPTPELADAVRAGRREEAARFGWAPGEVPDPQDEATFTRSVLDRSEPAAPGSVHARLLAWYRSLVALRRAEEDLRADDLRAVRVRYGPAHTGGPTAPGPGGADAAWLAVERGRFVVAVNLTADPVTVPLPRTGEVRLAWDPATTVDPDGTAVRLPPRSPAVVRLGPGGGQVWAPR